MSCCGLEEKRQTRVKRAGRRGAQHCSVPMELETTDFVPCALCPSLAHPIIPPPFLMILLWSPCSSLLGSFAKKVSARSFSVE